MDVVSRSVQRRFRSADIVVANHALVLIQAALGGDEAAPDHHVIDEGHHLFDAADSVFSPSDGRGNAELRRRLLGAETEAFPIPWIEGSNPGYRRQRRRCLAGDGGRFESRPRVTVPATRRIADGQPLGAAEMGLMLVRRQVLARAGNAGDDQSGNGTLPAVEGLIEAAATLRAALNRLAKPTGMLIARWPSCRSRR